MPDEYAPKIIAIDPTVTTDKDLRTVPAFRVTYRVGKYNPPPLVIAERDFTAEKVRGMMQAVADEISKLPTTG